MVCASPLVGGLGPVQFLVQLRVVLKAALPCALTGMVPKGLLAVAMPLSTPNIP